MKKTAFLKKLLSVILSAVMFLTLFSGTLSVFADSSVSVNSEWTDLLLGNKSGRVYGVPFSLVNEVDYSPNYETLKYSELVDMNAYWNRFGSDIYVSGTSADTDDPSLVYLTDGNSDEVVHLRDASDSIVSTTGKYIVETHRMAVAYDLGGFCNTEVLRLELEGDPKRNILRNFSVYAGETLDGSIFNNRIAIGGTDSATTKELIVDAKAEYVRYIVIVFDHLTTYYSKAVNRYGYDVFLTQINLYGNGMKNILTGDGVTGNIYNITLDQPYIQTSSTIETWTKRDYTNFAPCGTSRDYVFYINDSNNALVSTNSLGISNDEVLRDLANGCKNTEFYEASHTTGGLVVPNEHRMAIGYDLGGYYNLDTFTIEQALTKGIIYNFSVYAGNTFDATIFNNCIGEYEFGKQTSVTVDLRAATAVKYVMIVFDHISSAYTPTQTNAYGYYPRFTNIKLLGIKTDKPKYELGDINCDKENNIFDFIALMKGMISGNLSISVADLNYDGVVDAKDLVVIKKVLLGMEVTIPVYYSDYYTLRNGLTNTYNKIKDGKNITMAFMGGSITYGIGTTNLAYSFRNLTENWLESQYGISITQYNLAIPSACSDVGAFAVEEDVLAHNPDLVFVEYAINDKYAKALYTQDEISANIETIIRKIRINNPNCDIVLLYTTDSNVSYTDPFFTESALHEAVAKHYGVMSVNIGHALRQTKQLTHLQAENWNDYFYDMCHTNEGGNKVYAEVIKEAMLSAFRAEDEEILTNISLPEPKNENLPMNSLYVKTANVSIEGSTGFKKASTQWDVFSQYQGYIYTDTSNNELVYTFTGTSFAVLGFTSKEFTYSLDGGAWQSFAKFNSHPQPIVENLEYKEHTIRVKISNPDNAKIIISAFLIGQPQTSADAYNTEYVKLRDGLVNTYNKLTVDKSLKVAYIGGSITAGAGATDQKTTAWRPLTTAWLKSRFPDAKITEINRGIGSTGSLLPTYYLDDFVITEAPDLVFLEVAVNDYLEHRTYEECSVQYESIIRKLLTANPKCEIVALYTINDVISIDEEYFTQALAQNDIAEYYGIPSANMGRKLRIDKGLITPKVNGAYTQDWKTYFGDEVHPTNAGHTEYANTVAYLLNSAFNMAKASGEAASDKILPTQKNSELLLETSFILASELDLSNSTGWEKTAVKNVTSLGITECISASDPNNELVFTFTGDRLYFYSSAIPFDGTAPLYKISIDGGEWVQVGPSGANPITAITGLNFGTHTVRFIAGGVGENAKSDTYRTYSLTAILAK